MTLILTKSLIGVCESAGAGTRVPHPAVSMGMSLNWTVERRAYSVGLSVGSRMEVAAQAVETDSERLAKEHRRVKGEQQQQCRWRNGGRTQKTRKYQ
jgi:hypothetical protein